MGILLIPKGLGEKPGHNCFLKSAGLDTVISHGEDHSKEQEPLLRRHLTPYPIRGCFKEGIWNVPFLSVHRTSKDGSGNIPVLCHIRLY